MALRFARGVKFPSALRCGGYRAGLPLRGLGVRYQGEAVAQPTQPAQPAAVDVKASNNADDDDIFDDHMTPEQVVEQLDKYIIGQNDAKRAMALALRNRWRRHRVEGPLRSEISPKNILMVGPTGVGKTEVARRLAKLTNAPFCKVECTKFTEVGYHGKDVDSIIDDLLRASITQVKSHMRKVHKKKAREVAIQNTLKNMCGESEETRETYRSMIEADPIPEELANITFPVVVTQNKFPDKMNMGQILFVVNEPAQERRQQNMTVKEAMEYFEKEEMEKLLSSEDVMSRAVRACEEDGIVVLDEIDKIVVPGGVSIGSSGASAEGVQQDLLPLVEGTSVTTKTGPTIRTDRILFIASGAFHNAKPKDMLAELQGRLPIRVELQSLSQKDFLRILTEPKANLVRQHVEMMKTEGVELEVTDAAVKEMARVAFQCNQIVQNIGARRLITVTEKVLEDLSFTAPERKGEKITITDAEVKKSVSGLLKNDDLRKFIL